MTVSFHDGGTGGVSSVSSLFARMSRSVEGSSAIGDSCVLVVGHEHPQVSVLSSTKSGVDGSNVGVRFTTETFDVLERWVFGNFGEFLVRVVIHDARRRGR